MQVNSLGLGTLPPATATTAAQSAGTSTIDQLLANVAGNDSSSTSSTATARSILANYDITNISPRDFSQLLSDLHTSGTISDAELQSLAGISTELANQGIGEDEQVNLLQIFQSKLKQQIEAGQSAATGQTENVPSTQSPQQSIDQTQQQITWLQKFSTLHEEAASSPIDTMA